MSDLGHYVRHLRKSKNMTLKELSSGIVSETFLSKFERGQYDISASKLFALMVRLNVAPHELYSDLTADHQNNPYYFWEKFKQIKQKNNIHLAHMLIQQEKEYYKNNSHYRHLHHIIVLNQFINQYHSLSFDQNQIRQILQYLSQVDEWAMYEMELIEHLAFCLSAEQLNWIFGSIFKKMKEKRIHDFSLQITYRFITNMISRLIDLDEIYVAEKAINQLNERLAGTTYFYELNLITYLRGLIKIKKGDIKAGRNLADQAIKIMNHFQYFDMASYCEHQVQVLLM